MTLQEIFNTAYRGLRAQGFEQATDARGICQYRTPDGKRCAIGHCIPDKLYRSGMEGSSALEVARSLIWDWPVDQDIIPYLNALQSCHDLSATPKAMKMALRNFAQHYNLTIPE